MSTPTNFTSLFTAVACLSMTITTASFALPDSILSEKPIDRAINSELHLTHSWNAKLRISPTPERAIQVSIPFENMSYTLELEPHSIRADGYQVFMQDDEGELYEVPAGPIRTLRGSIAELEGSVVAGSLMNDGLYARIRLADGQEFWMEPVGEKIDGLTANVYAFYRTQDIIPSGGTCAADDHMDVASILAMQANYNPHGEYRGNVICTAQLGCDTDYEYYQDWGSQTESRINQVINSINSQYEDELSLTHEITTVIVRSSSNDPYTSNDAGTLLDQFQSEWNSNQGSIPRDLAHLFTGRNLNSGTIGIAWLGSVCSTSYAYGLAQSDCCGSFGCTTDLSAHEIGHGWSAGHVNSPAYQTMYPQIQCANLFVSTSITQITGFANSLNCLSCSNKSPQGACCISGNQCIETYQSTCELGSGIWQGAGTTCATANCADPEGACCVSGACSVSSEQDCQNAGGSYAGDGTSCATTGCTEGACCVGTDCSITLQSDCSGSWYGDNTTCADISCGVGADQLNYELRLWSRSDGQLMETYDLYFPSTDPNTKMVSVFGEDADFMLIQAWSNADFDGSALQTSFHQSPFGSDLPHDRQLDGILGDDLKFDSYVTIGSDDSAIGIPITLGFDSAGFNGSGAYMTNGVYFVTPDDVLATIGAGTPQGHRLLSLSVESMQGIEIMTNIQWFDGAGFVHENRNIYWDNEGLGGGPDCPTDIDGNGSTDVGDLLALIGDWGPCSGCASDLDGNGVVNVSDLLEVIGAWGLCQ